jgi:hypothetical protein
MYARSPSHHYSGNRIPSTPESPSILGSGVVPALSPYSETIRSSFVTTTWNLKMQELYFAALKINVDIRHERGVVT